MGLRFRKTISVLPGVRLNLSKSGVSASIGGKGVTLNLGRRGARGTVGLPGTGLSYSTRLDRPRGRKGRDADAGEPSAPGLLASLAALITGGRGRGGDRS